MRLWILDADAVSQARRYRPTDGKPWPACQQCEHCDGVHSPLVRIDALRGHVCPLCDVALDALLR
jgi:hypothetical protein